MKNFTKILNLIACGTKASADTSYEDDPCCLALRFASMSHLHTLKISELYNELKQGVISESVFKKRCMDLLIAGLDLFFTDYCECQQNATASQCYTQLNNRLNTHTTMSSWIESNIAGSMPEGMGVREKILRSFLAAFTAFFDRAVDINVTDVNDEYDDIRTDNLRNFLDDICKIHSGTVMQAMHYGLILSSVNERNVPIMRSIEEISNFRIELSPVYEAPERICVPVLDEETQSSLPAWGISETALVSCLVGAGLYMGRGPIKSVCRRLLGLNKGATTAAVAACVAASMQRTGTATVNPEDPALKALIGEVLDKTCSESGQVELFRCDDAMEGGEDAGGEVDAPGGGDVGAGGDLL